MDCYLAAERHIKAARGQAFNIGGGIANGSSLLELFALLEEMVGVKLHYRRLPWRHSDQRFFVADIGKARRLLKWSPRIAKREGIKLMHAWAEQITL